MGKNPLRKKISFRLIYATEFLILFFVPLLLFSTNFTAKYDTHMS